jgi:hypothetical protein
MWHRSDRCSGRSARSATRRASRASSALQNFGLIKCAYVLLLAAALAVVGLLLGNPVVLSTYVPGWKGTAGMVLLCASMLSMSLALIRFFRAAVFLAVWSFVSLVLASEIFLGKLPQQVIREDIDKIEDLFPSAKVNAILKKYGVDDDILRVREVLEES